MPRGARSADRSPVGAVSPARIRRSERHWASSPGSPRRPGATSSRGRLNRTTAGTSTTAPNAVSPRAAAGIPTPAASDSSTPSIGSTPRMPTPRARTQMPPKTTGKTRLMPRRSAGPADTPQGRDQDTQSRSGRLAMPAPRQCRRSSTGEAPRNRSQTAVQTMASGLTRGPSGSFPASISGGFRPRARQMAEIGRPYCHAPAMAPARGRTVHRCRGPAAPVRQDRTRPGREGAGQSRAATDPHHSAPRPAGARNAALAARPRAPAPRAEAGHGADPHHSAPPPTAPARPRPRRPGRGGARSTVRAGRPRASGRGKGSGHGPDPFPRPQRAPARQGQHGPRPRYA